jgi:hypothetical protein
MAGYSELFNLVVCSAAWPEAEWTLRVWITLRALANKKGFMKTTPAGLASIARVSVDECLLAIGKLKDLKQVTEEDFENGFQLLGYEKDAEVIKDAERREYMRDAQADFRERKKETVEYKLAKLLLDEILKRKPDFRKPDLLKWTKHIDKMIRLDEGRTPEKIEAVIRWCQADEGDGGKWKGWQNNILSTEKLRKHFDKIELSMKSQGETIGQQLDRLRLEGEI